MKPSERKANFIEALCNTYGYDVEITRKQIHEVWEKSPEKFTHPLPMEKQLKVARGVYKTPRQAQVSVQPKKQRTVKQVLDILSLDTDDTSFYNEYVNEEDDINEILRML